MDSTIRRLNFVTKGLKLRELIRISNMEFEKDENGVEILDEQGNKIPIKIIDAKDEEFAKVKDQLVSEIQELRLKLGMTEGLLKEKEKVPESDPNKLLTDEQKLEAIVDKRLQAQAVSNAQANKKAAFEKFIIDNKEFSPENDPTGLKRNALQEKFNRFNADGLTKVEEFLSVIGEAKTLLLGNDSSIDTTKGTNPYSNPPKNPNNPPAKRNDELTPKELKLIAQSGTTKERIMKLKATNPEYLRNLMEYVRD